MEKPPAWLSRAITLFAVLSVVVIVLLPMFIGWITILGRLTR